MAKSKGKSGNKGGSKKGGKKGKADFLTKPLTRKGLNKEVGALQRLGVGSEIKQVKGEKRATRVQGRRINDWFGEYGKTVDAAKASSGTGYTAATSAIGATSDKAANYAETLRQRLAGEASADAERRGVAYDPSGSHTSVDANLARVNAANVLSNVVSSQGATQNAYLSDKKRIGERERVEQQIRNDERKRSFNADLRDLARRKGDLGIQERGRLRSEERDYKLGQAAAGQAADDSSNYQKFAAKQQRRSLRGDRASRKGQFKLARLQNKHNKQDDERSLKWKNQGKSGGGGGKKGPPGSREERTDARAFLNDAPKNSSTKQLVQYLQGKRGIPHDVAKRTVKRSKIGFLKHNRGGVLGDKERRRRDKRAKFTP